MIAHLKISHGLQGIKLHSSREVADVAEVTWNNTSVNINTSLYKSLRIPSVTLTSSYSDAMQVGTVITQTVEFHKSYIQGYELISD